MAGSAGQGDGRDTGDELASPKLIRQFVVFPLALVAVGVSVYLFLGILTSEDRSARDYLNTIRTGGLNSRWQAAYELVKVLSVERREGRVEPGFAEDLVRVFGASERDDPRIRRYLARAMEMVDDPIVVEALLGAMEDPDEETRLYAIHSLGGLRAARAVGPLITMAELDDAGFRKAAVYALGQIGDPRGVLALRRAVRDRVSDVRWNAALQLARAGDASGADVLGEMMDRTAMGTIPGLTEEQKVTAMVYAIRAAGSLRASRFRHTLEHLRSEDPSLKVRQAAIEVLNTWP